MPEQHEDDHIDQPSDGIIRHEDYVTLYANNVQFQPFEWDLRMTFGELDVRKGQVIIEQHTAITVTWLQAKLMLYFLGLQVAVHEMSHEPIRIPKSVFPPEPTLPSGDLPNDPIALKVYEYIKAERDRLLASSALI